MSATQNGLALDVPSIDQRAILLEELAEWHAARYRMEVRYRVAERIGDPPQRLEQIRAELERCERALDALAAELRGVGA